VSDDAPKSAYELAMERLRRKDAEQGVVPTSLSDIYVTHGELVAVPSFAYLENRGFQYSPDEFGVNAQGDYLGKLTTTQGFLFLAYGLSDSFSVGLTVAAGDATFKKASDDTTAVPAQIDESGLTAIRPEITWRILRETEKLPEVVAYLSAAVPHNGGDQLIGAGDWVLTPGLGVIRGFSWATLVARLGFEYDFSSVSQLDFGAWTLEGQRRFSPKWWASLGLEGTVGGGSNFDEVYLAAEVLWQPKPRFGVRIRPRLGLTSQTEGWGIEAGFVVKFSRDRTKGAP